MLWIAFTLVAIVFQLFRNSYSKKLSFKYNSLTVSLCRFLFGLPLIAFLFCLSIFAGYAIEINSSIFLFWIFIFSFAQLSANTLLVRLFDFKNFAVSITFTKSESIFTAFLGFIFLLEKPSFLGLIAILSAFLGLMITSFSKEKISLKNLKKSFYQKGSYLGILSGFIFAIAAVSIKNALSYLESDLLLSKALFALLFSLLIQSASLLTYLYFKNLDEIKEIFKNIKYPLIVGNLSALGSFFWFLAFSMTLVVYVKTLGQLEFLLSILISAYYFKEKIYKNELIGMLIMFLATITLVFA